MDEQGALLAVVRRELGTLERCANLARLQIGMVDEYRARLIADVVTGKVDVREAAAGLPEVDPLAAEDDPDDGSNPEVWSDSDQVGVTGQEAEA